MTDPLLPPVRKDLRQMYLDGDEMSLEQEREVLVSIRQGYSASTIAATKSRTTRTVKAAGAKKDSAAIQKLGASVLDLI